MRNAETMKPEELRALAEEKEQREAESRMLVGYAKHALFSIDSLRSIASRVDYGMSSLTENEVKNILSEVKNLVERIARKGQRFECFVYKDGTQSWYDEKGWFVDMDAEWAQKHLERIGPYRPIRSPKPGIKKATKKPAKRT